uniref:Pentraxin (PTX) domain-containing protein n=1 Tax=Anguilla anguilla TaxID=7936 RepID=A0A0E9XLD6_ANGAN
MWDYVLPESKIKALHSDYIPSVSTGNIFDWGSLKYEIHGNVLVASAD